MDTVLIVDDEQFFRAVLADFVTERLQMHPVLAQDGPTALSLLERQPVELVLLDIIMPGMDGLEVLREIKERSPALPVIMVTGSESTEHALTALCEGADDFVRKPVDLDELQLCVTRTMTRTRPAEAAARPAPTPGRERRKAPRVPVQGEPAALVPLTQLEVAVIDLSVSGALVEHTQRVRPGEVYRLSFPLGDRRVHVLARAVRAFASDRVVLAGGESQLIYRTGMQFVGLDKATADLIAAHVEQLLKERQRGMGDGIP